MNAQFVEDDPKFEDQIRKAKQELSELLKEHPDLERIYRPERFQPITDVYTYVFFVSLEPPHISSSNWTDIMIFSISFIILQDKRKRWGR